MEKIVIMGSAHPLRGGLSAYNERLAREFIAEGNDVTLYTFSLQYPSIFFPGKTQYSDEPAPSGLKIRVRINSVNPLNWIIVGLELRRIKPDLIVVKFWIPFMAPCLGTICRIARLGRKTRVVSVVDNIIPHEKRPGDNLLARFWVGSVHGFVAMSHSVMKELEGFNRRKSRMFCPHPLYDNFGKPVLKSEALTNLRLNPDNRYILFFGFIRDYKGLDLLIRAMADDRITRLGVKLIVAGEFYTDPEPYLAMVAELDLKESIIMYNDFIPDHQVVNYFCACDLVVQPYKSATQSGVSQIAYHFNKPMIITDVGGLSEIVPDGRVGYVVPPDPQAIATAVFRYFSEEREEEFSANAAIEKQKYLWSKMTSAIRQAAD